METVLGRTKLRVNKDGFGALPIQRVDMQTAKEILQKALESGINFFDTARMYTDSEEKIGAALGSKRKQFLLATKTMAATVEELWADLHTSLEKLQTDYVDIYQFHNPAVCPAPGDGSGLYEAMEQAKKEGKVRFIGLTNHRLSVARQAVESGRYDTVQYPFSYLSSGGEEELVGLCREKDVGFIAMKALSGGLITDIGLARGYLAQFENVVPIWGIQSRKELDELLQITGSSGELSEVQKKRIEQDRRELDGEFCRGCGYCAPCPAGIMIHQCARMSLMVRRARTSDYTTPYWQAEMDKIPGCIQCGQCAEKCPYKLNPPELLKKNYADYQSFI